MLFVKTGEEVARVVIEKLKELGIFDKVAGLCFDTCAANTGWARGMTIPFKVIHAMQKKKKKRKKNEINNSFKFVYKK